MIMFKPVIVDDFLNKTYFEYLDSYLHSYACRWKFNQNLYGSFGTKRK